jgi:urease beta subunit
MEFDNLNASSLEMQAVYVLGDYPVQVASFFHFSKGVMAGIRFRIQQ